MRTITQITAAITAVVTRDGRNTVDGQGSRRGRLIMRLRLFVGDLPRLLSSCCNLKHGLNGCHAASECLYAMRYLRDHVGVRPLCHVWLALPQASVKTG